MEPAWAQRIRSIIHKQQQSVFDAEIDSENHLIFRTVNNGDLDLGLVKPKTPGVVAYIGYEVFADEPALYITRDGASWRGASSQGRFTFGTGDNTDGGCWTGNRFLVNVWKVDDVSSQILQSRDGGTWALHSDLNLSIFNGSNVKITSMAATGTGLVVIVGDTFGETEDSNVAISYDYGETFEVIPYDLSLYPFSGFALSGVCLKNEKEWCITDGTTVWYTFDGGGHWNEVIYPSDFSLVPSHYYSSSMRYFNGCWWFYGIGSGPDEWDTPLIKSEDLSTWIPVVTPWSGTYPPYDPYDGPHYSSSGEIHVLEYDLLTNTIIAIGQSNVNHSDMLLSIDGGRAWLEIGYIEDDYFRTDYDWEGIYKWPAWNFVSGGGAKCAHGWWFVANAFGTIDVENIPSIIRISLDGKTTEVVYPHLQKDMYGYVLLSGGNVASEERK